MYIHDSEDLANIENIDNIYEPAWEIVPNSLLPSLINHTHVVDKKSEEKSDSSDSEEEKKEDEKDSDKEKEDSDKSIEELKKQIEEFTKLDENPAELKPSFLEFENLDALPNDLSNNALPHDKLRAGIISNVNEYFRTFLKEPEVESLANVFPVGFSTSTYSYINYESTKTCKKQIVFLNFEDDTCRPVLKTNDTEFLSHIETLYSNCNLLFDIEETDVIIPTNIELSDMEEYLFQDIPTANKTDFLTGYIPCIIGNIISEKSIAAFKTKCSSSIRGGVVQYQSKSQSLKPRKTDYFSLSEMGIVIPDNINSPVEKNSHFNIHPKHFMSDVTPFNTSSDSFVRPKKDDAIHIPAIDFSEMNSYDKFVGNFCENPMELHKYPYDKDFGVIMSSKTLDYNTSNILVVIHNKFLNTLTLKDAGNSIYIDNLRNKIKEHPEYGFTELFYVKTDNKDIIDFIETQYNTKSFDSIEDVNKKLSLTSQYMDFSIKNRETNNDVKLNEEKLVKDFLKDCYTFNKDINHKMKASVLYDNIVNSNILKNNDHNLINAYSDQTPKNLIGFKTRLSKYLKDLGLEKKRYNDGYYYYGIVSKSNGVFDWMCYNTRN